MKTLAFISKKGLTSAYSNMLQKYKNHDILGDFLKTIFLLIVFLVVAIFYLRYVSLASTRGYFLRQENQKLNNISFQYEIIKTQLLEQKLRNRGVLDGDVNERPMIIVPIDIASGMQDTPK